MTTLTIQHFLASPDAMEILPKEVTRVPLRGHAHFDVGAHTGWAHRIPMGAAPRRQTRTGGGLVRVVPRLSEPWPDTAEQWHYQAVVSQMQVDRRRQEAWESRQRFRQEMAAMARAGGMVIGCLLAMAAFWLVAWGLWAVAG